MNLISCFLFLNFLFSFVVSLHKWFLHLMFTRDNGEIIRIEQWDKKTTISFTFLIRLKFQWYLCKSELTIFAWRGFWKSVRLILQPHSLNNPKEDVYRFGYVRVRGWSYNLIYLMILQSLYIGLDMWEWEVDPTTSSTQWSYWVCIHRFGYVRVRGWSYSPILSTILQSSVVLRICTVLLVRYEQTYIDLKNVMIVLRSGRTHSVRQHSMQCRFAVTICIVIT